MKTDPGPSRKPPLIFSCIILCCAGSLCYAQPTGGASATIRGLVLDPLRGGHQGRRRRDSESGFPLQPAAALDF
jgi:hypothetical protein